MVKLNYKGSSLVEVLIALVIIMIIFGLTISFFNNRNLVKSKKDFSQFLKIKRHLIDHNSLEEDLGFNIRKSILRDSLCEIEIITLDSDTLQRNAILRINPIKK